MESVSSRAVRRALEKYPPKGRRTREKERSAFIDGYMDCASWDGRRRSGGEFFEALAKALDALWPEGDKLGAYPWRCPVPDLKARLAALWQSRKTGDRYSLEDCVRAASRYVSQFEGGDATYMMTVKNFVYRTEPSPDGGTRFVSKLLELLESAPDTGAAVADTGVSDGGNLV